MVNNILDALSYTPDPVPGKDFTTKISATEEKLYMAPGRVIERVIGIERAVEVAREWLGFKMPSRALTGIS